MVQMNDSVPRTVNIVTEGNPPGQPVEVALEAGKTVSFVMPENIPMTPMPFLNGGTHTTGGSLNFHAEPIAGRLKANPNSSQLFSSTVHGDPYTPMVRAYLGDTVVFRLLQTMANETMVWTLSGHTYLTERYAGDANRKNSIHVGIAERYDWSCLKRVDRGSNRATTFTSTVVHRSFPRAHGEFCECWTRKRPTFRSCRLDTAVAMKFPNRWPCVRPMPRPRVSMSWPWTTRP